MAGDVAVDGSQQSTATQSFEDLDSRPRSGLRLGRTDESPNPNPSRNRPRTTRTTRWVVGGTLLSLLGYALVRHFTRVDMVDMVVYRAEGDTVRQGRDLYAMVVPQFNLSATYPPFAALLFVPTSLIPVGVLRVLVTVGNFALLGTLARLAFQLVGWPRHSLRPQAVVAAVGFGVWLEPVWTTLRYGQINLLLACLVLADLNRSDGSRRKGLLIGIAAGIKLTPGLFGVYLLLTGRPRAALTSFAAFLGTVLLGGIALPNDSWHFWTNYLYDAHRVGRTQISDNQSVRGTLARLLHEPDPTLSWAVLAGLTALAGLGISAAIVRNRQHLPRAEAWGVLCAAVTALLISPISWTHHWVWCVPIIVLLGAEAAAERSRPHGPRHLRWRIVLGGALVCFLGFSMWLTPHSPDASLRLRSWEQPLSSVYSLFGLLLLGVALTRLLRCRHAAELRLTAVLPTQRECPLAPLERST